MPVFRLRNRVEILRQMVARVVARSRISKLARTSVVLHVLAAASDSDADIYFQLAKLRKLFSADDATGSDLDERLAEIQPGTIRRRTQVYATTALVFSRQTTVGTVAIASGAIGGARDSLGAVNFRTTATASIPDGATQSAPVPAVATTAGIRANVDAGQVRFLITRIPGVTGVNNPSAVANGVGREPDDQFLRRAKGFIAALARGTTAAIEGAVKQVRLADGRAVLFSKVSRPAVPNGIVQCYIDDGSGSVETYDSTFIAALDVIVPSASGGETTAFSSQRPLRDDISITLQVNGTLMVRGVDWEVDPTAGLFELLPGGILPTGLLAGDILAANYRFYTGLIQEAQKVVNGDAADRLNYSGYVAAGERCVVLPAAAVFQSLAASLSVLSGFDPNAVRAGVVAAVQTYINGLDVGEDALVSKIIELAMLVPGVENFRIRTLTGGTPPVDQIMAEHQVARIVSNDIVIG